MYPKTNLSLWYLLNLIFVFLASFCFAEATQSNLNPSRGFLQNQGQWPEEDLYRVNASGFSIAFMKDGLRFVSSREIESDEEDSELTAEEHSEMEEAEYHVWTMRFKNCEESIKLESSKMVARRTNFFLGNDPDKWVRQAPEFANLYYEEVWPGIDVHFYLLASGELKYDFILSPEADLSNIEVVYAGLEGLSVRKDGQLELHHPWHPVLEAAPEAWQLEDQTPVEVRFRITGKDSYGFEVKGEVPSGVTWVIDPILQVWSTFTRSTGFTNYARDVAHDQQGRLYMTGTADVTFPSTVGTYQPINGGGLDAYIARFSSDGTTLDYMTFLGGSSLDLASSLKRSNGNIYFCGYTTSLDFPTTNSLGFNITGYNQPFVACISNDGSNLIYSSFLCSGGSGVANALQTVSNGEVIVAGYVTIAGNITTGFPTTPGAYTTTHQGNGMGWVCRLNAVGDAFIWSTMIGGSNSERVANIAVNAQEEPYIVGRTESYNFPTTAGALYPNFSGNNYTGFVTHLNATGTALIGSTFFGDAMSAVHVDQATGDVYVGGGGMASGGVFTPTPGAWQTTSSGSYNGILARLDPTLGNMMFGTLVGGLWYESVYDIEVNQAGEIYFSGHTSSSDFPISSCQLQSGFAGGVDVFLVHFNPQASELASGGVALFGGQHADYYTFNLSLRESTAGDTLFTVLTTHSPGFPVTPGAYQTTKLSTSSGDTPVAMKLFVPRWELGAALCQEDSVQVFSPPSSSNPVWSTNETSSSIWIDQIGTYWVAFDYHGCTIVDTFEVVGSSISIQFGGDTSFCAGSVSPVALTANSGTDWLWSTGQTTASISTTGPGTYWVQATDSVTGCSAADTFAILEVPLPIISLAPGSFCEGDSILLTADPGNLYPDASFLWSNADTNAQTFISAPGQVWVEVTDSNGCTSQALTTVSQIPGPSFNLGPDLDLCEGDSVVLSAAAQGSGMDFIWNTGAMGETLLVDQPGIYSVTVIDTQNGCTNNDTLIINLIPGPVVVLPEDTLVCDTNLFILDPGVFDTYSWSDGSGLAQLEVSQPGEYAVTVTTNNCMNSARSQVNFGRRPVVDLGPDLELCRGDQLVLHVTELLNGTVIWSDGGSGWSRSIDEAGTYWAKVNNSCGMDSDTILVEIGQGAADLFIPNVFSPNNDAINDCYRVNGRNSDIFHLQVFDRWGRLVFETRDINECWDGNFRGRPLPESVYFGTVKLLDCFGKRVTETETITLVR